MLEQIVVDLEELGAADRGARRVEQEMHAGRTRRSRAAPCRSTCARCVTSTLSASAWLPLALTADAVSFDAGLVDVGADHVGALAREDQRGGAADAARCAGDDDGLAREIVRRLRHGAFPPVRSRLRTRHVGPPRGAPQRGTGDTAIAAAASAGRRVSRRWWRCRSVPPCPGWTAAGRARCAVPVRWCRARVLSAGSGWRCCRRPLRRRNARVPARDPAKAAAYASDADISLADSVTGG